MCSLEGCENKDRAKGLCAKHYARFIRTGTTDLNPRFNPRRGWSTRVPGEPRYFDKDSGYINTWHPGHWHANKKNGYVKEHIYVMTNHLGRRLYKDENVHHKNGDRKDNRLENLELWSTSQPPGQRIEDKLKWAHELIEKYENDTIKFI